MSNDTLRQLMAIFRDEAHENLDELGQLLEQFRGATGDALNDKINTAMRVAHNLKGASSSVGLDSMAEIAHRLEDRLLSLRGGRGSVEEIMALSQRAIGAMQHLTDGETLDVHTTNGGVTARNVSGQLEASTTNGGLDIDLAKVAEGGVKLDCTNGGIKVRAIGEDNHRQLIVWKTLDGGAKADGFAIVPHAFVALIGIEEPAEAVADMLFSAETGGASRG